MKKIVKITAVVLCFAFLCCFAACSGAGKEENVTSFPDSTGGTEPITSEISDEETLPSAPETSAAEETVPAETTEENSSAEETAAEETTADEAKKDAGTADPAAPADSVRYSSVGDAMAAMTLEEKVGQVFVIMPEALLPETQNVKLTSLELDGVLSVTDGMRENYARYPAGGFILFGRNISTAPLLRSFTSELHALGTVRPFVYIDEEGGTVARIGNSGTISVPQFGNMQSIADTGDPDNAYNAGAQIGGYLAEYGIDLDFAPVADVNTNPDNPVIGKRAFGSDPELAGEMVAAVIRGLHSAGVGSCIKHFPGHGDTKTDSHTGYAETLKTWDEIKACEMLPFRAGIDAGTDMVMAAHIAVPAVIGDGTPSTLSYTMLTEKLRGELGYNGVIITDSMMMAAVADKYTSSQAAVAAFKAGADIILMPNDYAAAFNGLLDAVRSGEITEARLNASVERILRMKWNGYGL